MASNRLRVNLVLVLIMTLLFLVSCIPDSRDDLLPNEFTQRFNTLQANNINEIKEIKAWKVMENGNEISLVQHNLELNRLTVFGKQKTEAVLFAMDREEVMATHLLNVPNLRVLNIVNDGEKLLVGLSNQMRNEQGELREFFHWFAVWDLPTNAIETCLSVSCSDLLTHPDEIALTYIGAVMETDSFIAYDEDTYSVINLSPENGGGVALVNSPEADYWWHIGKIALNSSRNQAAIVFQEGRIVLDEIWSKSVIPLNGIHVLEEGIKHQLEPVQFVELDKTGKWLSVIRGTRISIWSIGGIIKRKLFSDQISDVHGILFNPTGELLFVAAGEQIRIIGLREQEEIMEIQTPGITSLDISDDNRLLIWGDRDGQIHIWGVSE